MKRLHLLRHAKSSWGDATLPDHERLLSRRGERAAALLASWIAENEVRPRLVLCSTAARARATLGTVSESLGTADTSFEDGLYHASAAALVARIRAIDDRIDEALLVGHNPGLQDLCLLLAVESPERDHIAAKLPTGALVTLDLDVDSWAGTDAGRARVLEVVLPREL